MVNGEIAMRKMPPKAHVSPALQAKLAAVDLIVDPAVVCRQLATFDDLWVITYGYEPSFGLRLPSRVIIGLRGDVVMRAWPRHQVRYLRYLHTKLILCFLTKGGPPTVAYVGSMNYTNSGLCECMLTVREPSQLSGLVMLFEHLWEQGITSSANEDVQPASAPVVSAKPAE